MSVLGCQLRPHWEAAVSARQGHCWPFELAAKQRGRCVLWLDRPKSHFKAPPSSCMESTHQIHEQNPGCHGDEGYGTWRALLLRTTVCSWASVLRGPMTMQQCRKSQVLHAREWVCVYVQADTAVLLGPWEPLLVDGEGLLFTWEQVGSVLLLSPKSKKKREPSQCEGGWDQALLPDSQGKNTRSSWQRAMGLIVGAADPRKPAGPAPRGATV